jgi:DNA repair exonuclease SbcCD ATPase subunit
MKIGHQKIIAHMKKNHLHSSILTLVIMLVTALIAGALIFSYLEGWHFIDAFYFVTMTATTVGYGDFTPTTKLSKIITIIYALSIVPFVLYTFAIIAKYQAENIYNKIHHLEREQDKQEDELEVTERKIREQKKKIREQEKQLARQNKKIEKEVTQTKKQGVAIQEQEKELEGQDAELEVLEDIVEDVIEDKGKKKKSKSKP